MAEGLHTPNELPISSSTGWMQMESLLNKNLPVKKRPAGIGLLISCLPALLCSFFTFSFLQLNNKFFHATVVNNIPVAFQKPVANLLSLPGYNDNQHVLNTHALAKKTNAKFALDYTIYSLLPVKNKSADDMPGRMNNENFIKYIPEKKAAIKIDVNLPAGFNNQLNFSADNNRQNKNPDKKSWEFSAGIGMNITEGKHQNLQPYPVAEFKYNVSARFFIAAGMSFLSPKAGNIAGISKTVYVNDTVSNISLYNEVIAYDRLRYVDVPVSAGVNISKKITFQAGVQASVLISKQQKKSLEPYDFQMRNIDLPYVAPPIAMAANPQQEFKVQMPNIDYRFIAGVKYKFNRTTAGVFYQQGLQSSKESNISKTGNRLFTLNLLYQIK
jgi:hypothetical protein